MFSLEIVKQVKCIFYFLITSALQAYFRVDEWPSCVDCEKWKFTLAHNFLNGPIITY